MVADVIPNPPQTAFLQEAARHGCVTLDGLGMLVNQAVIPPLYRPGSRLMRVDEVIGELSTSRHQ